MVFWLGSKSNLQGYLTVTCLTMVVTKITTRDGAKTELCQNEVMSAKCGQNEVVVMTHAKYGRMKFSHCVDRDYGYVGCAEDVINEADALCSGRRECRISVPNSLFDERKPCPKDLKSYLEADYTCLKVESGHGQRCVKDPFIKLTSSSGYLASVETRDTDRGSAKCPWQIKAPPGQKINITLYDFAVSPANKKGCQAYAILTEKTPARTLTVCAGMERKRHIYTSVTDSLEIRILSARAKDTNKYFLLHYEGCADPNIPENTWIERAGNTVKIGCQSSSQVWSLTCDKNSWRGTLGNCSEPATGSVFGQMSWKNSTLPFAASIFVIFAIAVALGIVILIIGLLFINCRRRRRPLPPREDHIYQSTKLPPGIQAQQLPPVMVHGDTDSLYQSSENEYSYIADLQTGGQISPRPQPNFPNREMDAYQSRTCPDYGTTRQNAKHVSQTVMSHKGRAPPIGSARYVETGEPPAGNHPAYFVLDNNHPPTSSVDAAPMPQRQNINNNTASAKAFVSPIKSADEALLKTMNQSIHEFTSCTYDHMNPENCNHKSV